MSDLHPNWQATDASAEEQSLPVRIVEKPNQNEQRVTSTLSNPPHMQRLSRQPAAIAGMLLAISIGLSFFFGMDRGTETTVRITENGFSPKTISVSAGNAITWTNETDRPQVLQSDALCTNDQGCFSTQSIAPGASETFTLTDDYEAGTYAYYSITTRGMEASITVIADNAGTKSTAVNVAAKQNLAQAVAFGNETQSSIPASAAGKSSSAPSRSGAQTSFPFANEDAPTDITSSLMGNEPPPSDHSFGGKQDNLLADASFSSSGSRSGSIQLAELPVNPYTVNSTRTHPFDDQGKPVTGNSGSSAKSSALHGTARPISQPETGSALWITIAGTFALLFFATRKMLQRAY